MVLVFSDDNKLTIELLSKGAELTKDLGTKLTAIIIGKGDEKLANEFISYGAEEVIIAETDLDGNSQPDLTSGQTDPLCIPLIL